MKPYTLGLYEKAMPNSLNWEEKLIFAKEANYDFVEISIDETEEKLARLDWTREERTALIALMYKTGIPIRTMCLSGHRKFPLGSNDPTVSARGMAIMEKAIELAEDLGIRIIQLAGYDVYYEQGQEQTRKRFEDNLYKAVQMAAAAGVTMGFETMETDFMNTCKKAMSYVKKLDSIYLGVYPDCGNINNAALLTGEDVTQDLKTCCGHVVAIHLKESKPGKFRDMMYGEGSVDFPLIIEIAWKMGIRRYVTEFWYQGEEQWAENLLYANRFMRELLDAKVLEI